MKQHFKSVWIIAGLISLAMAASASPLQGSAVQAFCKKYSCKKQAMHDESNYPSAQWLKNDDGSYIHGQEREYKINYRNQEVNVKFGVLYKLEGRRSETGKVVDGYPGMSAKVLGSLPHSVKVGQLTTGDILRMKNHDYFKDALKFISASDIKYDIYRECISKSPIKQGRYGPAKVMSISKNFANSQGLVEITCYRSTYSDDRIGLVQDYFEVTAKLIPDQSPWKK